ncbi:tyrosine-type recombinase/integrase [Longimicrobium sp.]|uniref:tyrosine-type recombinase/integrase n=1 Tax=Longimicrobium sp. TaxID=2029185 RepID=UPI002E33B1D6|nr:tyrosine-type recombinase/integrase [Longimicrobium sp.]HEX6038869.1 tyrosine-type recombinase/integrase [Longimicrobium sp.]
MRVKIGARTVAALESGQTVWDTEITGFHVRLQRANGRASYLLQYSLLGRLRVLTLGRAGKITVHQARLLAQQRLGELASGQDPAAARDRAKGVPTVEEFSKRYLAEVSDTKKRPASAANDRRYLRTYVNPALGRDRLDALDVPRVAGFHHGMRKTPATANRCLALLSHMLSTAERWHLRPQGSNPCKLVERFRERPRERYLTGEELATVGAALAAAEAEAPYMTAGVLLLAYTGARPSEVAGLRWSWLDLERGRAQLPDSKTGRRVLRLTGPALSVLRTLPRLARNPYVLPGHKRGTHVRPGSLGHFWLRVARGAGLRGVRLYDLRHTFASVGATSGKGLPTIGGILGHRRAETTERYVHLAADPLAAAADEIGREIAAAMRGGAGTGAGTSGEPEGPRAARRRPRSRTSPRRAATRRPRSADS